MQQQLTAAYSTNAFANAPAFALPPKSALVRQDISYHQYFRHISHDRLQYMCVPSEYDEAPHQTAHFIEEWASQGFVNIVGGCCGTTPDHIKHIADHVRKIAPRKKPIVATSIA